MPALWSGALNFGLINIPVKLYSASVARPLNFKLLEKHSKCEISYQRICKVNHKEVAYEDIVKGYRLGPSDYIVLTDEDFKKAQAEKLENIDIVNFSDQKGIDPIYYEKPYYLEPEKKSARAYGLLCHALTETKKLAIARFVLRERQHLAALKPLEDMLVLYQLRFEDEIRPPKDLVIPKTEKFNKKDLAIAENLIARLTEKFKPGKFKDTYADKLMAIIRAKAKGRRLPVLSAKTLPPKGEVFDLMAALKTSLEKTKA